ncbi:hypothetical protein CXG50_08985 [Pseudomonas plecoglossicida]|uniref:Diguanylate cyclase n=1 Tax=Pseudomonas plecoglossicida TaxID=70775 RepID=A0ABX4TYS5_PSEDL|nr:hypothetical protein CX682_05920 [Pseudomonas sp. FFUP_PS_41]PLU87471.1 hypothetical protein CXG44_09790 [Pseudomonas plecoglossicida]QKK99052.1 hypothetical protein GEV38_25200 [Pseudomonas sp. 13159349]TXI06730.1 MAG: hypothetical protein E6Q70_07390 [Pseudomonas monteilii]PLU92765.1 hypothetical protein CXG45_13855 [Pseudomonas plecoglossicida]
MNLQGPYRRQASSHKNRTGLKACAIPVGAGLPAIGPGQAVPTGTTHGFRPVQFLWELACRR